VVIHVASGRGKEVRWPAYVLAAVLIVRFVYMGSRA
jgi:hypothetical protein